MTFTPFTDNQISQTNSSDVLLNAGAVFTGVWENVTKFTTTAIAVIGSNATDGVLCVDTSQDGGVTIRTIQFTIPNTTSSTPHIWNLVEEFIRIRYINGSTGQTGSFNIQTKYSIGQELGILRLAGGNINSNTAVQTVKSVNTGTDPNGSYSNSVISGVDNANSSTVTLGISALFTGAWTDASLFHGISVLVDGTSAGTADGTLRMKFSHDGVTDHRVISITISDVTTAAPRTLGVVARYFKVEYQNGTTAMTSFDLQTMYHTQQVSLVSRLNSGISGNEDVSFVRAINAGSNPNNTFENIPISGVDNANSSTVTLGISALFPGAWTDVSLFHGISVLVDGTSAGTADGTLRMKFSHDGVTDHRVISITISDVTTAAPRTFRCSGQVLQG